MKSCKICKKATKNKTCPACFRVLKYLEQAPHLLTKIQEHLIVNDTRPKLFIDMDNTIVDFDNSPYLKNWNKKSRPYPMYEKKFFFELKPFEGAIPSIVRLIESGKYNIHILSKPLAGSSKSYNEKVEWVLIHLPMLKDKIILTQNKLIISDKNAILIDDDKEWESFQGKFIHFKYLENPRVQWENIVNKLLK